MAGNDILILGEHDAQTLEQLRTVAKNAAYAALMADGHVGYVMPIGGVAAYRNQVSVVGVGFDIACGNCALRSDLVASDFSERQWMELADSLAREIRFGLGGINTADDAPRDHPLFRSPAWQALPGHVRSDLRDKARSQLGTVGSGNHYVDIFADTVDDHIWVGVHFGSRGLGHSIASGFMALGQGARWEQRVPEREVLLDLDSELGKRYWSLMTLAGEYAYAGRDYIAGKVLAMLGGKQLDRVHNHHNFAWREQHFGEELIVVRKGATPAFPGQRGFIGGSMGDNAVIVAGYESRGGVRHDPVFDLQQRALFSTIHGAGRVMSRTAARGRPGSGKRPRQKAAITREMMREWTSSRGIIVRGGDVDESPHVYRRLDAVLEEQRGTIAVQHVLRPLIVLMDGA